MEEMMDEDVFEAPEKKKITQAIFREQINKKTLSSIELEELFIDTDNTGEGDY
jgi:hypothetical protein